MVAAGVTFLSVLLHKKPSVRVGMMGNKPILLFLIYVIWMWIQLPWAVSPAEHQYGVTLFTKYLIVIFLIYTVIDTKQRMLEFLFAHSMGCFYLGVLAYTSYTGGRLDGVGGPGINDASSLGMQLSTGAVAAATVFFAEKRKYRWLAAASLPFILNAVVMTGSRGAFLALLAGGVVFLFFRPRGQTSFALLSAIAGLSLFAYMANDAFWARMSSIDNVVENRSEVDKSTETRLVVIRKQLEMVKAYPFGAGHKGTAALSYQYIDEEYQSRGAGRGRSSHNTIMSSLVDQGIPGIIIWLWIWLSLASKSLSIRKWCHVSERKEECWLNAGISGGLAVIFVAGMFSPQIKAESFVWYIALLCSLFQLSEIMHPSLRPLVNTATSSR